MSTPEWTPGQSPYGTTGQYQSIVTAPPKWKMFVTILPSAYLISAVVILALGRFLHDWPFLALNLACMLICLRFLDHAEQG